MAPFRPDIARASMTFSPIGGCRHLRTTRRSNHTGVAQYFVRIPQNPMNAQDWINTLQCVVLLGFTISNALLKNV
jgi:hypothetical protein